jgi:nucleoside phosphorylase
MQSSLTKTAAIFVATRWEFSAVRAAIPDARFSRLGARDVVCGRRGAMEVTLIQCGVGPDRARAAAADVLSAETFAVAVSSGYAAALLPLAVGTVVIGTAAEGVSRGSPAADTRSVTASREYVEQFARAARHAELRAEQGPMVSVPHVVTVARDKMELAVATRAIAVDMESAAIAAEAAARRIPFVACRTISDTYDEDLPVDFNLFLRARDWPRGLWHVASRPGRLTGLWRLRAQAATASRTLTACIARWLDETSPSQGVRAAW